MEQTTVTLEAIKACDNGEATTIRAQYAHRESNETRHEVQSIYRLRTNVHNAQLCLCENIKETYVCCVDFYTPSILADSEQAGYGNDVDTQRHEVRSNNVIFRFIWLKICKRSKKCVKINLTFL